MKIISPFQKKYLQLIRFTIIYSENDTDFVKKQRRNLIINHKPNNMLMAI